MRIDRQAQIDWLLAAEARVAADHARHHQEQRLAEQGVALRAGLVQSLLTLAGEMVLVQTFAPQEPLKRGG